LPPEVRFLRLKFCFGWGSAQTRLGSLQRSPRLLARFNGPTSKWRESLERTERKAMEGKGGEEWERMEGEGN